MDGKFNANWLTASPTSGEQQWNRNSKLYRQHRCSTHWNVDLYRWWHYPYNYHHPSRSISFALSNAKYSVSGKYIWWFQRRSKLRIAWTISSNAAWLTTSPSSGSGNASVTVSHTTNTGEQRTGILTFSGSGITQTVTVTQAAANSLAVSPANQSVNASAGSSSITVTSNVAWTVSSNANWLTPNPSSGSNNGTVMASYTANVGATRTGTLTFTGGGLTRTATITQAGKSSLTVTPTTQSVAKDAGSFSITVSSRSPGQSTQVPPG